MKKGCLLTGLSVLSFAVAAQITVLPDSINRIIESKPTDTATIISLNKLAFSYLKSNPEMGRELAEKTMALAEAIHFTRGYARSINVKGSSFWVIGDYESALEQYQIAAKACRSINDMIGLSEAYNNIGEVHKKLGDYRKAIRYLELSLEWDRKNNVNHAITLYNIGEAYIERDEFDQAASYFDMALTKSIEEGDDRAKAYSYNGIGRLKMHEGDYKEALDFFTKAESLWRENGELRSLIQTYQDFSDAYSALGEGAAAMAMITKARSLATEIQAMDLQVSNYERLAKLHYAGGDYKKSADFLQKRSDLRDSIYDLGRSQAIARLQVEFETNARLIENQQLKASRALQEARIKTQNFMIIAISAGLIVSGFLALIFFRQRKKISVTNSLLHEKTDEINKQKEEIECQAKALKDLNQQLQDLNKSLESRIEERTHQLWWKNQKLADYAHTNSHKLRAPVASILGLIQLLDRINIPEEDRILLEKLHICAKDLDKITRDINQSLEEDPELIESLTEVRH